MQHQGQDGHRARAVTFGVMAVLVTIGGAAGAWGGFLHEVHRLERRSAIRTLDALPVLLWAALLLALLWAVALILLATWSIARGAMGTNADGTNAGAGGGPVSPRGGGLVGRLAGILLALAALSSLSATAPACAAVTPSAAATASYSVPGHLVSHLSGDASEGTGSVDGSCTAPPTPGWTPDRPSRTDQVARECAPLITGKPVADDSAHVVVHRDDTLWSIAAAHLGPHADAHEIAAEWPRWYAANRQLIGDDPDLLTIGISLQPPTPVLEGSSR